jgi:hypothetical protein
VEPVLGGGDDARLAGAAEGLRRGEGWRIIAAPVGVRVTDAEAGGQPGDSRATADQAAS